MGNAPKRPADWCRFGGKSEFGRFLAGVLEECTGWKAWEKVLCESGNPTGLAVRNKSEDTILKDL